MTSKQLGYFTLFIIIVVIVIHILFYIFFIDQSLTIENLNFNFLALAIAMLTMITTIAVSLAAYKVFSSRDVKSVVAEQMELWETKNEQGKAHFENTIKENHIRQYKLLSTNMELMLELVQQHAKNTLKERKDNFGNCKGFSKIIDYSNFMDKEILFTMRMAILISSPFTEDRIKGYSEISTLGCDGVHEFLSKQQVHETDENLRSLINEKIDLVSGN